MSDNTQRELIVFRLNQADESIKEAQTLFQASLYRGAVNRAYYAMFYAALALTVLKQQVVSKHSGVIAFFDKEFIRTGIFAKDLSRYLHFAFDRRQNSDYGDLFLADSKDASQAIQEANEFVQIIKNYLLEIK